LETIRFPEDINKVEFLENYAARLLECISVSMASSFEQTLTPEGDELWYKYLKINLDKGVRYIIIEDTGIIRGYLVWYYHLDEVEFYDLIIHPEHQGDCITLRKLLSEFAADIQDMGFVNLLAYTNFRNDRMNGILLKHGFTVREVKTRGTLYYISIDKFLKKFLKNSGDGRRL